MNLRDCKTRDEVDVFFAEKKLSEGNYEAKNAYLLDAMNNPKVFYSNGNPSDEEKYEMLLISFLSGKWKYSDMLAKVKENESDSTRHER